MSRLRFTGIATLLLLLLPGTLSCQRSPEYRELLLTAINKQHGPHLTQRLLDMPFLHSPDQGADLPLLHAILHSGCLPGYGPITDAQTWRLASHQDCDSPETPAHDPLRHVAIRHFGHHTVGVVYRRDLNTTIPWHTIGRALHYGAILSGKPLPRFTGNTIVIVYGGPVPGPSQAVIRHSHIALRNAYANAPDAAGWILAHEIAHYWWQKPAPYINEGMAELIARLSHPGLAQPAATQTTCTQTQVDPTVNRHPTPCDYRLGGDLFYRLYQADPADFTARARQLAQARNPDVNDLRRIFRDDRYQAALTQFLPTNR